MDFSPRINDLKCPLKAEAKHHLHSMTALSFKETLSELFLRYKLCQQLIFTNNLSWLVLIIMSGFFVIV